MRQKDSAKHSKCIKVKVCTQVRAEFEEQAAPMGSRRKLLLNAGNGGIGWSSASDSDGVMANAAALVPPLQIVISYFFFLFIYFF